jgi:plastocyanin
MSTHIHPDWEETEDDGIAVAAVLPNRVIAMSRQPAAIIGIALVIGIGFMALDGHSLFTAQVTQADATVHITAGGADPTDVTIRPGQVVRWINDDQIPHVLSSADLPTADGKEFLTSAVFPGDSIDYVAPATATAGSYEYVSKTSESVAGTIIIEGSTGAAPISTSRSSVATISSSSSSRIVQTTPATPLPAGLLVNPHTVGGAKATGPAVTHHTPTTTSQTGPKTLWFIVLGSIGILVITTRKYFRA